MTLLTKIVTGIFGKKSEKDLQILRPIIDDINSVFPSLNSLSDLELKQKIQYFQQKLQERVTENNVPWISPLELLDHLNTIVGSAEMVVSIKQGRRVEVLKQNRTQSGFKMTENCVIESETNSVKTKVVDSCQNLVAIGHIMWENEASYFHPKRVFV